MPLVFLCENLELQTHSLHEQHPQQLKAHWPELGKPAGRARLGLCPQGPLLPEDWAANVQENRLWLADFRSHRVRDWLFLGIAGLSREPTVQTVCAAAFP